MARLDDDEKDVGKADNLGGSQDMTLISESGLYTLIMRSNKPEAKVFRKWVTSEVLPSIRKTGSYSVNQTQAQLAELYKTSVQNVGQRIRNILEDEELQADSVLKDSLITDTEGNRVGFPARTC